MIWRGVFHASFGCCIALIGVDCLCLGLCGGAPPPTVFPSVVASATLLFNHLRFRYVVEFRCQTLDAAFSNNLECAVVGWVFISFFVLDLDCGSCRWMWRFVWICRCDGAM